MESVEQDAEDAEQTQGPNALSGAAAAEEEAAAQERLMRRPPSASERAGSRGRLWRAFESILPNLAGTICPPALTVPEGFDPHLAVVPATVSTDECSICLAPLGTCVTTPCGHSFHAACLEHYFDTSRQPGQRPRCPYCRCSVHAPVPIEARATSDRPLEVVAVPARWSRCHPDRSYQFLDLGDFARPGMLYLHACNEDRKTPASTVMWVLEATVPCTVHINYRSAAHVVNGGQEAWLAAAGFSPNGDLRSASSSGVPNGPYSGPVYSRACAPGTINLMGSNYWEGVYFVFVELQR